MAGLGRAAWSMCLVHAPTHHRKGALHVAPAHTLCPRALAPRDSQQSCDANTAVQCGCTTTRRVALVDGPDSAVVYEQQVVAGSVPERPQSEDNNIVGPGNK